MKTTMTMLKAGLVGLFLMVFTASYSQEFTPPITSPGSLDVGAKPVAGNTVPEGATVLFYNPDTGGPTFTIAPSLADENGIEFDYYLWARVREDGSTYDDVEIQASVNDGKYVIASDGEEGPLAPGYHVFRVTGFVSESGGASICSSTDWQDYAVYVLPPLSVAAGLAPESSAILEYCEINVPSDANAIILSTTDLTFKTAPESGESGTYKAISTDFVSPTTSDFEYNYQWYSIKLNGDGSAGVRTAITGANTSEYEVNLAPEQDGYDGPGTYIFEVEVEYTAKNKELRDYVTYVGRAQNATGDDLEITITPQPGRPTITIEAVND